MVILNFIGPFEESIQSNIYLRISYIKFVYLQIHVALANITQSMKITIFVEKIKKKNARLYMIQFQYPDTSINVIEYITTVV